MGAAEIVLGKLPFIPLLARERRGKDMQIFKSLQAVSALRECHTDGLLQR